MNEETRGEPIRTVRPRPNLFQTPDAVRSPLNANFNHLQGHPQLQQIFLNERPAEHTQKETQTPKPYIICTRDLRHLRQPAADPFLKYFSFRFFEIGL